MSSTADLSYQIHHPSVAPYFPLCKQLASDWLEDLKSSWNETYYQEDDGALEYYERVFEDIQKVCKDPHLDIFDFISKILMKEYSGIIVKKIAEDSFGFFDTFEKFSEDFDDSFIPIPIPNLTKQLEVEFTKYVKKYESS